MNKEFQVGQLVRTAIEAQKKGNLAAAESACREAMAIDQDNPLIQNQLVMLLHFQGKSEKGLKLLAGLLDEKPDFPDGLFSLGKILFDLGQFKDAAIPLEKAAGIWPYKDARPWILLGKTYLHLRQFEMAVKWLKQGLEKNPNAVAAKNDLGLALKNVQKPQEAIKVFEDAIAQSSENPVLYFNLALAQLDLGEAEKAEALFQMAVKIKPDYLEAHEALNETIGRKSDDYLKSYSEAIQKMPKNLELRLKFVDTLLKTGDEEQGLLALRDIEQAFGQSPETLSRQAKILITRDKNLDALSNFEKAVALDPTAIDHKLEAGKLLIRLGDYEKALEHINNGLALNEFHQELIGYQMMCWRLLGDDREKTMNDYDAFVCPAKIPVPAGYKDIDEFNQALLEALSKFHKPNLQPLDQSLRHGSQTLASLFSMDVREIREARDAMAGAIQTFIDGLPASKTHPFLKRNTGKFEFSGSWSIRLNDQGFHVNHVHTEGWISGPYYVQLPDVVKLGKGNEGCVKFGESPLKLGEREHIGKIVRPEEGVMVMFPSYMWHGTFPFSSQETRTTMPFDIIPV